MTRPLICADLFCGAGGSSTGLARAAEAAGRKIELIAVNHWDVAVATHAANHPWANHKNTSLEGVDPRKLVPGGRLDLLVASPECTHHSTARGGKPMSDQSRSSAWRVIEWAEALRPTEILVENVPEFRTWGPLRTDGRPMVSKRGETYEAWIGALRAIGYTVEARVLNAADYGDPTTRRRLFVRARRGRQRPAWPAPTHCKPGSETLFAGRLQPWRSARDAVIDWTVRGHSIFDRKRPLADATLRRIAEGLRRFGGAGAEPFLTLLRGTGGARSLDEPLPSLTAGGEHVALAQPFITQVAHGDNKPGSGRANAARVRSMGEPVPTITGSGGLGVVEPFIVPQFGEAEGQRPRTHAIGDPVPAVTSHGAGALVEPFMLGQQSGGAPRAVSSPTPTLAAKGAVAMVEPMMLSAGGPKVPARPVSQPMNTVLTRDHMALAEPVIVSFYGNGQGHSIHAPLPTATTKDRFGLAEPRQLDILFRMLQPHELARAMGFPEGYVFKGNRTDVVRQIGNAVAVCTAEALCGAVLRSAA